MSISLMTAAFRSPLPATQKLVLLALSDCANDQGECYPSIPHLEAKCSLSDRAIQSAVQDIEKGGYLRREFRNGRSTVYWITPPESWPSQPDPRTSFTPERRSPPKQVHPTPERASPPPPNVVHPTPERRSPITIKEPSKESSGEPKEKPQAAFDDVDPQVVSDWIELRKAKKAPITATAVAAIRREAAKAGVSVQRALEVSIERNWIGFKADWYAEQGRRANGSHAPIDIAARDAEARRLLGFAPEEVPHA